MAADLVGYLAQDAILSSMRCHLVQHEMPSYVMHGTDYLVGTFCLRVSFLVATLVCVGIFSFPVGQWADVVDVFETFGEIAGRTESDAV